MKAILQCLIFGGLVALAACGKDSGSSAAAPAPTAVVTPNGCATNQIPTQAGCGVCAPQCGVGQALVGQTCYPIIATTAATTPTTYATPYGTPYGSPYGTPYAGPYGNPYGPNTYGTAAYGANSCATGYNGGYTNGYNNGYPYPTNVYSSGGTVMYYNTETQSFSNYYSQAPYNNPYGYGYGYRPYNNNGLYVSGQVTFGF
jgi:hypothetical protein